MKRTHMRATVLAFMSSLLSVTSSLVTNLIVYRELAAREGLGNFGSLTLMLSLVGYLSLLELGLNYGAARFVAAAHGTGDDKKVVAIVGNTARLNIILAASVIIAGVGFYLLLFTGDATRLAALREHAKAWGVIVVWQASTFIFRAWGALLIGTGRQWVANLVAVGVSLGASLATLVLLRLGYGIAAFGWGNLVAALLGGLVTVWLSGGAQIVRKALRTPLDPPLLRSMLQFNLWVFLGGVLWGVQSTLDQWATATLLGSSAAGIVFLMYRFPLQAAAFAGRAPDSAAPALTSLVSAGMRGRAASALHRMLKLAVGVSVVSVASWTMLGPSVMAIWMPGLGATSRESLLYALGAFANFPLLTIVTAWMASSLLRNYVIGLSVQLGLKLTMLLGLLPRIGALAVPVSTAASMAAFTLFEIARARKAGLLPESVFRELGILTLTSGALAGAITWTSLWLTVGVTRPAARIACLSAGGVLPLVLIGYRFFTERADRLRLETAIVSLLGGRRKTATGVEP